MFPQGAPGVALLLLRTSVAAILIANSANFSDWAGRIFFAGAVLVSIFVIAGFLTPYLSIVAVGISIANFFAAAEPNRLTSVFIICDAVALALLGPGAYSVDSRLFGRRVTVVTPQRHLDQ